MKKWIMVTIIVAIMSILAIIGILIWLYIDFKENERIDAEAVTLVDDLTVEFGKKAKVSDFISNLNGTLLNDYEIDTEHLGDVQVKFNFLNIKNRERTATFNIRTKDVNAPKIFSGSSYTVKVGYTKNLTDVLLSGDDIDDHPKREIIGEYDVNTVGDYNLKYVVTDSSNNTSSKDFVLHVVEKVSKAKTSTDKKQFSDVIGKYKNDRTKIGIDVSKWQGDINWEKVKNAGVEFAIIRVGYQTDYDGDYVVDPYFEKNIKGANSVRLTSGDLFLFVC